MSIQAQNIILRWAKPSDTVVKKIALSEFGAAPYGMFCNEHVQKPEWIGVYRVQQCMIGRSK